MFLFKLFNCKKENIIKADSDSDENLKKQLFHYYKVQKGRFVPRDFPFDIKYNFEIVKLINDFSLTEYIKEIRVINPYSGAMTLFDINDGKVEITISLAAIKMGIGNNDNSIELDEDDLIKTLTHELFHAKHIVNIYNTYGIDEITKIRKMPKDENPDQFWTRISWLVFDEYCVRRENASKYQDIYAPYKYDNVATELCYIKGRIAENLCNIECQKNGKPEYDLFDFIEKLFYDCSTLIALEEEGQNFDRNGLDQFADEIKRCFSNYYNKMPIRFSDYELIGTKLKKILDSNVK